MHEIREITEGTFDKLKGWLELLDLDGAESASRIIVGNKSDRFDERQVSYALAKVEIHYLRS